MGLEQVTESQVEVTWQQLESLASELRQISTETSSVSLTLIGLNRFFTTVERYLSERGLKTDGKGFWLMEHWGYTLLRQLATQIESCKASGCHLDESFLNFVELKLLPRLKPYSSPESLKSS